MKTCASCQEAKPESDFYQHDKKCKECRKAMVRAARARNIDHYREFDRNRAMRPDRVAARAEYAKTEEGKEARRRARLRWQADNGKRWAANNALSFAIRTRKIKKLPCFVCGGKTVEGHHPNYDAPLDVIWLCAKHHKQLHKESIEHIEENDTTQ